MIAIGTLGDLETFLRACSQLLQQHRGASLTIAAEDVEILAIGMRAAHRCVTLEMVARRRRASPDRAGDQLFDFARTGGPPSARATAPRADLGANVVAFPRRPAFDDGGDTA